MSKLTSLLALIAISCIANFHPCDAAYWDDLRVKYDLNGFAAFYRTGRTVSEATNEHNLVLDISQADCVGNLDNGATFNGFRAYDPKEPIMSMLYDKNGVIAGVQAWFPQDDILTPENNFRFDLVPMFQNGTRGNKTYFVETAYFVDPSTICETGRTEEDLVIEGTGNGLWLQRGPSAEYTDQVPKNRTEAIDNGWTRNACFPGMGRHNFYRVDTYDATDCREADGAFMLYNNQDELIGFGFRIQGLSNSKFVEQPPNLAISAILGDPVPQCILDYNTLVGSTTMHVYFTDSPWLILCPLNDNE